MHANRTGAGGAVPDPSGWHSCINCGISVETPLDHDGEKLCATCWNRRTQWDEGARSVALHNLGRAVELALHWDVPQWAIRRMVELSIEKEPHPDFAMALGGGLEVND